MSATETTQQTPQSHLKKQDLATLDITTLTPLSPEVISRQATINIGTIGHVAHGKSTVVKAISGVQTVRFKNELERNITIKLGESLRPCFVRLKRLQESDIARIIQNLKIKSLNCDDSTPQQKRGIKRKLETSPVDGKKMKQPSILAYFQSPENRKVESPSSRDILHSMTNFEITVDMNNSDGESIISDVTSNSLESCKENRRRTQRTRKSVAISHDYVFPDNDKNSDSENCAAPPKKKKKTGPGNYEVEAVVDYSVIKGSMHFFVKWEGYSSKENTWEPFDNIKDCQPFEDFFEKEYASKREKLESIKQVLYEEMKEEISAIKEKPKEEILRILRKDFNDVEFKCNFMLYDFLENEKQEKRFRSWFRNQIVLNYMFEMQEAQQAKYNEFLKNIRSLEENCTIRIENHVDFLGPPENFTYISENMPMPGIEIPDTPPIGCECEEECSKHSNCCAKGANSFFAYEMSGHGVKKLRLERRQPIYECNNRCKCGPNCLNRVVQNGIRTPLCLFKTKNRGWGVKSVHRIFKGTFICEYMGEIITHEEAEKRGQEYDNIGRNYLFDLDYDRDLEEPFTVDAFKFGNMARFINHSCDPNCVIWPVFHNCLDARFPRLAFFTNRRIEEGEELSIDYAGGVVRESDASREVSEFEQCRCGADNCRKFIFNR